MILPKPIYLPLVRLIERYTLLQVLRYGLVGVCAAGVHTLVALMFYQIFTIPATPSNFAGFLSGALISYFGSYYFTFGCSDGHKRMMPRFILVWLIGIAINVGVFQALLSAYAVPFLLNVFIAIALTPIAQFLMLKFWAFRA